MDVIGMVDSLPEQSKNELILSFLGATVFALETSNPAFAIKRLTITAARFGLLDQFRRECAEHDASEAARNEK
jgi:hypothetical protein